MTGDAGPQPDVHLMMLLTGADKLAGWAIWLFLFSVLHAARVGHGAFGVLLQLVLAALLAVLVGRVVPENDDGQRLPRSASLAIIMLAFVIIVSAALGAALTPKAPVTTG